MTVFSFGGNWSTLKLEIVRKYLGAYTTIMNKYRDRFQYVYIDAFAGTGYQTVSVNRYALSVGATIEAVAADDPHAVTFMLLGQPVLGC